MQNKMLETIDAETLVDMRFDETPCCVDGLVPQGVTILAGAPKVGKSWLALQICMQVAKGEKLWNIPTRQGRVLYLCLEDNYQGIQSRVNEITDAPSANLELCINTPTLNDGLLDTLEKYVCEHTDTRLIAIDTLQKIRNSGGEYSYGNDYDDIGKLKNFANEHNLSILVVHHTRKQESSDPFKTISGTTGITGAADANFVLEKIGAELCSAKLSCTGRSIRERELKLKHGENNFIWELLDDSAEIRDSVLPDEMLMIVDVMKTKLAYIGGNTDFVNMIKEHYPEFDLSAQRTKQMMIKYRYLLENRGLYFQSGKSNGKRFVEVTFDITKIVNSGGGDALQSENGKADPADPVGTCAPIVA